MIDGAGPELGQLNGAKHKQIGLMYRFPRWSVRAFAGVDFLLLVLGSVALAGFCIIIQQSGL